MLDGINGIKVDGGIKISPEEKARIKKLVDKEMEGETALDDETPSMSSKLIASNMFVFLATMAFIALIAGVIWNWFAPIAFPQVTFPQAFGLSTLIILFGTLEDASPTFLDDQLGKCMDACVAFVIAWSIHFFV